MKNKHAHNRILLLIVLSACVHVFFLYSPSNKVELPSQQDASFTVKLDTIYPKVQQSTKPHLEKKPPKKNNKKQLTKKNNTSKNLVPETQYTDMAQQETIPASSNAIRAKLLTQIKTKFTKHFDYPSIAQRKGWQGKVLLAFNINNKGNISEIHIKDSSGYAILDQAAHHSLSKIKKITINDWPFNMKQTFKLPIIYKLYEG